jgi:hypothetical protein
MVAVVLWTLICREPMGVLDLCGSHWIPADIFHTRAAEEVPHTGGQLS